MKFIKCKNCGYETIEDMVYCPKCGSKEWYEIDTDNISPDQEKQIQPEQTTQQVEKKKNETGWWIALWIIITFGVSFYIFLQTGDSDSTSDDASNNMVTSNAETYVWDAGDWGTGTLTVTAGYTDGVYKVSYNGPDFTGQYSNTLSVSGYFNLLKTVDGQEYFSSTMSGTSKYHFIRSSDGNTFTWGPLGSYQFKRTY